MVRPTFENIQSLHHWTDVLNEMSRCLQTNIDVLRHISEEATRRAGLEDTPESAKQYKHFQDVLRTTIIEQTFMKQQADHVRSFADRRAGQVRLSPLFTRSRY